jgi:PIN domain nuclease of toxin-antitoxin system
VRILLDSNILYWSIIDPEKISAAVAKILINRDNEAWVSSVSLAELRIKQRIGKLKLPDAFDQEVISLGYKMLPFRHEHSHWLSELPLHHRDPFDRMLVAQAAEEGLTLLTSDKTLSLYPIATILN